MMRIILIGQVLRRKHGLDVPMIFGCTIRQLRNHLEAQFKPGMNWENQGRWHVDHITPRSFFEDDKESRLACWHFSNLQPLWAEENMSKSRKIAGMSIFNRSLIVPRPEPIEYLEECDFSKRCEAVDMFAAGIYQ